MRRRHLALGLQVLLCLASASCLRFGYQRRPSGAGTGGSTGGRDTGAGTAGRTAVEAAGQTSAAGGVEGNAGGRMAGGAGVGGMRSVPTGGDGAIASCDPAMCDDAIDCTVDTCAADGSCDHKADNGACPGGVCMPDCFDGGCGQAPDSFALTCDNGDAQQVAGTIECQLAVGSSASLRLATCLDCEVTPGAGVTVGTHVVGNTAANVTVQQADTAAHAFDLQCSLGTPAFANDSRALTFSPLLHSDGFAIDGSADFSSNRNGVWVYDESIEALRQSQTCQSIDPYPVTTWTQGGDSWTDVGIDARVRLDSDCSCGGTVPRPLAGVILRSQPSTCLTRGTYVGCAIDAVNDELSILICSEQCTCSRYSDPQVVIPAGIDAGVWYNVALWVRGALISCEVSGADLASPVRLTFENDSVVPAKGSFGFVTGCANASFDDVRVTMLE